MGLAASQARLGYLTAKKSHLELDQQHITANRINISNRIMQLYELQKSANTSVDAEAFSLGLCKIKETAGKCCKNVFETLKQMGGISKEEVNRRINQLHEQDKQMEMHLKRIETQHNSVQSEYETVKKIIEKNIEMSFKKMGT